MGVEDHTYPNAECSIFNPFNNCTVYDVADFILYMQSNGAQLLDYKYTNNYKYSPENYFMVCEPINIDTEYRNLDIVYYNEISSDGYIERDLSEGCSYIFNLYIYVKYNDNYLSRRVIIFNYNYGLFIGLINKFIKIRLNKNYLENNSYINCIKQVIDNDLNFEKTAFISRPAFVVSDNNKNVANKLEIVTGFTDVPYNQLFACRLDEQGLPIDKSIDGDLDEIKRRGVYYLNIYYGNKRAVLMLDCDYYELPGIVYELIKKANKLYKEKNNIDL